MPNIDQVQLPDGSQYNLKDNISGYVTAGYVADAIDALTKANVGLGNVDNTSDLNKPVSTAQQTALNGKTDTTVIAPTEATTTASRRYEIGEQFILNGVLYTATAVIASGDSIIVNTNCVLSESITEQLKDIDLSADNVSFDNTGTDLVSENVEDAIKEVNEKTQHGFYNAWTNPNPRSAFAGQSVIITSNKVIDAFLIDLCRSSDGTLFGQAMCEIEKTTAMSYLRLTGSSVQHNSRNVSITQTDNTYTLTFADARIRTHGYGTSTYTDTTNNTEVIPVRILGLIHND